MAIAAPSDKHFRRAHVKPSRRRPVAWRPLWLLVRLLALGGVIAYGGWRGAAIVLDAETWQIGQVSVRGNHRLSTGEVLALVEGIRGEPILLARLDEWRERLLASPWVQDATFRRILPSRIEIVVRERQPIGIGRVGRALYLVDPRGVIVDEYGPAYADIDLPIIDGLVSPPSDGGPLVDEARVTLAARLLADLDQRPDLARMVSQIDVSQAYDAVVILEGDTVMLRLGDRDFADRLQEYVDLAPALRERVADMDYVDLRFDDRLYVLPRSSGRRAVAPARR
jgi:cell division protein FtsQ